MSTQRLMLVGLLSAAFVVAQDAPLALQVTGAVQQVLKLAPDDLAKMPRATAKLVSHGKESVYLGVRLHEVLQRAGVPHGKELRGKALTGYALPKHKMVIGYYSLLPNSIPMLSTTRSFSRTAPTGNHCLR